MEIEENKAIVMKRPGRPRTHPKEKSKKASGPLAMKLDEELLYKLSQTMLPVKSIAIILGCHVDTLYTRFAEILQAGRENRKASLSEAMWHKALVEKDTKMQIWLSKQHLGYKETQPEDQVPIQFNVQINEIPRGQ